MPSLRSRHTTIILICLGHSAQEYWLPFLWGTSWCRAWYPYWNVSLKCLQRCKTTEFIPCVLCKCDPAKINSHRKIHLWILAWFKQSQGWSSRVGANLLLLREDFSSAARVASQNKEWEIFGEHWKNIQTLSTFSKTCQRSDTKRTIIIFQRNRGLPRSLQWFRQSIPPFRRLHETRVTQGPPEYS